MIESELLQCYDISFGEDRVDEDIAVSHSDKNLPVQNDTTGKLVNNSR